MTRYKRWSAFGVVWATVLGIGNLFGEELPPLTLSEAVGLALQQNRQLEAVQHDRSAASSAKWEAKSVLLPQISFSSNYSKLESDRFKINPAEIPKALADLGSLFSNIGFTGETYTNKFQVSQLVFDRSVLGSIRLAKLRDAAAQWQENGQKQSVVFDTVAAYLDVLRGQELLAVQKQRLELADKQLQTTQTNFDVGLRIRTDVLRAQLTRSSALRDVVSAEVALERAQVALNQVLGIPLDQRHRFEGGPLATYNPPADLVGKFQAYASLFPIAEKNHPSIRIADLLVQQNEESVNMARGEFYPRVTAGGYWGYVDSGGLYLEKVEWAIQAGIQIPMFEGGRKIAKVRRTKEQWEAEKKRFENTVRIIQSLVEQSALALKEEQRNLEITVEANTLAEESYNRFKNLYDEGLADSLDLTQALTELVAAQTNVVTTRYGYLRIYAQLLAALGTIPTDDKTYSSGDWLTAIEPQEKPETNSASKPEKK